MVKRVLFSTFLEALVVLPAQAEQYTLPAGSTLHCRLTQTISTKLNFQGDAFTATVTEPAVINSREVVPYGSTLQGRIAWIERPGRVKGVGAMQLAVDKMTFPDGRSFPLAASLVTTSGAEGLISGPTSRLKDLEEVGIGMGGGGFLGTIFGGFHGAVIGGTIGGAAALADTLRKRGPALTLPTGTELNYQLSHELVVL